VQGSKNCIKAESDFLYADGPFEGKLDFFDPVLPEEARTKDMAFSFM
jgi:hypothetical protein